MGAFEDYINGSFQGLARGARELPENITNWARPAAQEGIKGYDGALTGTDLPYYGDDEISAAKEYFDRKPRSNTSRLVDLVGNYMPGAVASKAAPVAVQAGETVLGAGPAFKQRVAETALDMAPEARAQRAQDMGFTVDAYHGTKGDIPAFEARRAPKNEQMGLSGVHVAENPEFANLYADGKGGNVMPVKINPGKSLDGSALVMEGTPEAQILADLLKGTGRKPYFSSSTMDGTGPRMAAPLQSAIDMVSQAKAEKVLRSHGFDSVKYDAKYGSRGVNGMYTTAEGPAYVVFNPNNIRSRFAAFDPAKAGSNDLLAASANPLASLNELYRNREGQ